MSGCFEVVGSLAFVTNRRVLTFGDETPQKGVGQPFVLTPPAGHRLVGLAGLVGASHGTTKSPPEHALRFEV